MDPRLHEAEYPLPGGAVQRIRYFNESTIQKAVEETLSRIDPDRRGVIVRGRVDNDGVGAVLAARLNDIWSIGLIADYQKVSKEWGVGFETVFEW